MTLSQDEIKDDKGEGLYSMLRRRGFFWPSYEIYGGVAGFFDMGPMGSMLMDNIVDLWKRTFIIDEGFLQLDSPSVTPRIVFKHSGHLEQFTDALTRCSECGEPFRADHLLEDMIENPDSLEMEELKKELQGRNIKCPNCGGPLGPPEEFNLMFPTHIGPGNERPAFLHPETAQSIFLDFNLLLRANREKVPFGVAQIGKGFRNEISPRQGLVRQREFHMAEGEYFYDPEAEPDERYDKYHLLKIELVAASDPDTTIETTLGDAVKEGIIESPVLAHFMGVTQNFASKIGMDPGRTRFRQHLKKEMAHYARDCWDLEVLTSYGWIEAVGIADRSAYDLTAHERGSGQKMQASRVYDEPVKRKVKEVSCDMKVLGPLFKGKAKLIADAAMEINPERLEKTRENRIVEIEIGEDVVEVPTEAIQIEEKEEVITGESYIPHVIEPSFGIDRLMIAVLEHSYHEMGSSPQKDGSEDGSEVYRVLRLEPSMAPIKCGVFPLMAKDGLPEIALEIQERLREKGLNTFYDPSRSIGRRYARMDEVGTPYCVTIDYESKNNGDATVRWRDTGEQKRLDISSIPAEIDSLVRGERSW